MKETKNIKNYHNIVKCSFVTLSVYYTAFGMICYYYFGNMDPKIPIVLEVFGGENKQMDVARLLFCSSLIFSYPLTIYPTN